MATLFEPLFNCPEGSPPHWLNALGEGTGFNPDERYSSAPHRAAVATDAMEHEPEDRSAALEDAFASGFRKGREEAQAEWALRDGQREDLCHSLERLDQDMRAALSQRLAETVALLCEAAIAPLALDRETLERNCSTAARLLGDALDGATLRLHPEDIDFLGPAFAATWHILPDKRLERGSMRLETPEGDVLNGLSEWRASLTEALGLC